MARRAAEPLDVSFCRIFTMIYDTDTIRYSVLRDKASFERFRRDFWQLERAREALKTLQDSLDFKVAQFRSVAIPAFRNRGFESLPNDVIRGIVNACHQNSIEFLEKYPASKGIILVQHFQHLECVRKLALVNRQFRDVIYSMPQCFNDFGYEGSLSPTDLRRAMTRLTRCLPSRAGISFSPIEPSILDDYIEDAAIIRAYTYNERRSGFFVPPPENHLRKALPKLATVRFRMLRSDSVQAFTKRFSMPNLRDLELGPVASLLHFEKETLSALTRLDLGNYELLFAPALINNLRSMSSGALQDLTLEFTIDSNVDIPHEIQRLHFPSLKRLQISTSEKADAQAQRLTERLFNEIFSAFVAPGVEELGFEVESLSARLTTASPDVVLTELPVMKISCPKLKALNVAVSHMGRVDSAITALLDHFATVETFRFACNDLSLYSGFAELAKLRKLHIHCEFGVSVDDLERTLATVFSQETLKLETLQITCGSGVSNIPTDAASWHERLKGRMPVGLKISLS